MFKWPKKVKIGSLTFKIKYINPGSKGADLTENESGCINQNRHSIEIDKNMSEQMKLLVLIHEVLHGIGDVMSPNHSPFTKEGFTCTVAEFLTAALQSSGIIPTLSIDLPRQPRDKRKGKK